MHSASHHHGPDAVRAVPLLGAFDSDNASWLAVDAFLAEQSSLHFRQSMGWYRCGGGGAFYFVTMRGDRVIAASLVRTRRIPGIAKLVCRIMRGPVTRDAGDLDVHLRQLVDYLKRDAAFVSVNPYCHGMGVSDLNNSLKAAGWQVMPRSLSDYQATIVVDLTTDIEQIRANLRRSLRTQLNRGARLGIKIREGKDASAIEAFVAQHDAMAHRRGLAPIPVEVMRCLSGGPVAGESLMRLLIAEYEGQQVAGVLLVGAGDRVIYEWGVASEEEGHRQLPLSHMLHWEAINWAKSAGYHYYDFGGYWEERGDEDSINRFKTGFSKEIQHVVPEHYYPVRPLLTRALLLLATLRARTRS